MKRRDFIKQSGTLAAGWILAKELGALAQSQQKEATRSGSALILAPAPQFEISRLLYMQFMEPLGVTDSSVEAAWDYARDDWRRDFVETTRSLAPDCLRYGGLFSRYYKWREGVGPPARRPWMRNYVWGGRETNRVGTAEFVDFCRRTGAEPLYCVNFLSDGEKRYASTPEGDRRGDALEAADWVDYANTPGHKERTAHGHPAPFNIKLWQLGNETSYGTACFKKDEAIEATITFAKAMRARDPSIQLIGWGDNGWAADLLARAGEYLDYVAVHMMGQTPLRQDTVLRGLRYQAEPEQAWNELLEILPERVEKKLLAVEAVLEAKRAQAALAITEGHLSLAPHNSNPILAEWLTGVYHARVFNLYQRHGARVKIATAADFNGTRWTTNAVMHQVPGGVSYLLPVGAVARLFKRCNGSQGIRVTSCPRDLDVAASRAGDTFHLHVANLSFDQATSATFAVAGRTIVGGRVWQIAPESPRQEVSPLNPEVFLPQEHALKAGGRCSWRFPARSVAAVELNCAPG